MRSFNIWHSAGVIFEPLALACACGSTSCACNAVLTHSQGSPAWMSERSQDSLNPAGWRPPLTQVLRRPWAVGYCIPPCRDAAVCYEPEWKGPSSKGTLLSVQHLSSQSLAAVPVQHTYLRPTPWRASGPETASQTGKLLSLRRLQPSSPFSGEYWPRRSKGASKLMLELRTTPA